MPRNFPDKIGELKFHKFLRSKDSTALKSHKTAIYHEQIGQSRKHVSHIVKQADDEILARREVTAQEFFRLLVPHHPPTSYARSGDNHFVISRKVPDVQNVEQISDVRGKIHSGQISGLGMVQVTSLFLNERDLKPGNIVISRGRYAVKFDGDWCFSSLRKPGGNPTFTEEDIARLPYAKAGGYAHFNWLDVVVHGAFQNHSSRIVSPDIVNNTDFRLEINRQILKIAMLPDSFIEDFVAHYEPNPHYAAQMVQHLKSARFDLIHAASLNPSFQQYIRSHKPHHDIKTFMTELNQFRSSDDKVVIAQHSYSASDVASNLSKLGYSPPLPPENFSDDDEMPAPPPLPADETKSHLTRSMMREQHIDAATMKELRTAVTALGKRIEADKRTEAGIQNGYKDSN